MANIQSTLLAPGTYVLTQQTEVTGNASPILSLQNNYIIVETPEDTSISPDTGIPYNTPIFISSLTDYADRVGGVPTTGPSLISYNEVKNSFRHCPFGTPIYVIRVKSVPGVKLDFLNPVQFTRGNETIFAYPIVINGYPLGEVVYNNDNTYTHYGIIVQQSTPINQVADIVINAINDDAVLKQSVVALSNVYARISQNSVEIYPRLYGGTVDANFYLPPNTPIDQGGFVVPISPNDEIAETTDPKVQVRDYIHTIETAFDSELNLPGIVTCGVGYYKFKPVDRLALFLAAQRLVSREEFEWVHLVSSGPTDGSAIAQHYNYQKFNINSHFVSSGLAGDQDEDVVFVSQTNQFLRLQNTSVGLPQSTIDVKDINLPYQFTTTIQVRPTSNLLPYGSIITNASRTECYGVSKINGLDITSLNFPLTDTQISTAVAATDLIGPLKLLRFNNPSNVPLPSSVQFNLTDVQAATVQTFAFTLTVNSRVYNFILTSTFTSVTDLVNKIRAQMLSSGTGVYYVVQFTNITPNVGFTISNIDAGAWSSISVLNSTPAPVGTNLITPGLVPVGLPMLFQGQLISSNGTVYYVKKSFQSNSLALSQTLIVNNLVLTVPTAFYSKWVEYNIKNLRVAIAAFNPDSDLAFGQFTGIYSGQRSIKYNLTSNADFIPERLMYDSPLGHSFYSYPGCIDLESFEVPSTSFVAGVYFTKALREGFQVAPAGSNYPLQVLGTAVTITKADQNITNPLGMNAIRRVGNSIVVYGGRTLSSNNLFNETNTRFLLSSIIQSSRNLWDGYIFTLNDANLTYAEVGGIARGLLGTYFSLGAFEGSSSETAYAVVCDFTNNSASDRAAKIINVDGFIVARGLIERIFFRINALASGSLPRLTFQ
jgi:hypothetical protein